jgi:hypothetical protein
LGNYDYQEINELKIKGISSTYVVRTGIDTLRITPNLEGSLDESDLSRYDFHWILREGPRVLDTLSRKKDLEYPVKLEAVPYDLFYRVKDRITGVTWIANTKIDVSTAYSRGLLLMGENEEGYAEAEMLSMLYDTYQEYIDWNRPTTPARTHEPVSYRWCCEFNNYSGMGDDQNRLLYVRSFVDDNDTR